LSFKVRTEHSLWFTSTQLFINNLTLGLDKTQQPQTNPYIDLTSNQ